MMTLVVAAMAMTVSAQDKWYGSKEGGFALTFNANPVLNYVGNMFNGNTNNSLDDFEGVDGKGLFNGTTITGKYFLQDNLALDLGFGFNNNYNGQRLQPLFGADVIFQHTNDWSYSTITEGEGKDNYTYYGAPTNGLGLVLNAGVEYFIIPQISFGANLNFGVAKRWTWNSKDNKPEGEGAAKNYSRISHKDIKLLTNNLGANVSLNFYF